MPTLTYFGHQDAHICLTNANFEKVHPVFNKKPTEQASKSGRFFFLGLLLEIFLWFLVRAAGERCQC